MRGLWMAALGLCLTAGLAPATEKSGKLDLIEDKAPKCENHGTSIDFLDTPTEAAKQAKKESKLVFVLHVSGNFEDPRFT